MFKIILAIILFPLTIFANVFEYPLTDFSIAERAIRSSVNISGDFQQEKNMISLGIKLKSEGKFAISKESGILWQNTKPLTNITIIRNDQICTYSDTQVVSTINSADNQVLKNVLSMINSVFIQDYKEMAKYFDLYFTQSEDGYELGLITKDKTLASVINTMRVYGKSYVTRIEFSDVAGDITTIYFSNITNDAKNFSCPK